MKMHAVLGGLLMAAASLVCQAEVNLAAPGRSEADLKRDETSKPQQMLALMNIKPGAVVFDLLGGGGYFTELLSQAVGPNGKVYLHNNKAYMPYVGKELEARLAGNRLKNVVRYDKEVDDLGLAENSVDAVFFVMGYHDMYHVSENWKIDPAQLMAQIRKALKPNGLMLVVDHNANPGTGIQSGQELHRIEAAYVKNELAKFGFELVTASDALQNPQDDHSLSVFDPAIRYHTDRFVFVVRNNKAATK
ncbi:class I SAM-dependent methyltransferase [Permianibacter sp. IMCC34836]|uniref:class I SAM-dependent methyltransferase n=1 Tax=Permianibacter fluminis TaxID=2738515 RepID=UPI0015563B75|nr:methyltransferase domain-containing protein [Permianibacter fluminis]NQD36776.1 class I SAM-dependent methyltransferase [Permianibacter fluminis]